MYIFLPFLAFLATFAGSFQTGLKVDLPGQKSFVKILYLPVANLVVQLSLVAAAFDDPVFFSNSSVPPLLLHLQKLRKELSMSHGGSSHWNRMQTNNPLPPQGGDEPAQESVAHPRNMYAKEQIATFSSLPISCDSIHISCFTSRFFVCIHSHPFPAILSYLIHAHLSNGYFQTRC